MANLTPLQKTNFVGFPKAAELIEITGAHLLDAHDRAVQNLLFQHAHDSGRMVEKDAEWGLTFSEIRKSISSHKGNDRVRDSLNKLMKVELTVNYIEKSSGRPKILKTHLLEFIVTDQEDDNTSSFEYGIPNKLRLVLANSNRWGRVRSQITYAMTSKYSIALYEMLCLRANMQRCVEVFPIDRFRDLLGVPPGSYQRADNFIAKVITPAITEVNGLSDITVQIELRRVNPRSPIREVVMAWSRKEGEEMRKAVKERDASKLGRLARLKGMSETPVAQQAPLPLPSLQPLSEAEKQRSDALRRDANRRKFT
jgi:hypothetical protein